MSILILVRNYTPAHEQIMNGGWEVAAVAKAAFDLGSSPYFFLTIPCC